MSLLSVENLSITIGTGRKARRLVDGISFAVDQGQSVALVGESGSGKSLSALGLMRLLPSHVTVAADRIDFQGQDLTRLSERQMTGLRGNRIAMIFQEPMSSLNPMMTAGAHVAESLRLHRGLGKAAARDEAIALLARVGIPAPAQRYDEYPHRMSGGMRQRVMIAAALACRPALLIADEPTTALDVTIQAQILDLLDSLRDEFGMATLLITHDLRLVEERADKVLVMYAGRLVERLPSDRLGLAAHPYTAALLRCIPGSDPGQRLENIPGHVPPPDRMPVGCRFAPRCTLAGEDCRAAVPAMRDIVPGHQAACLRSPA